MITNLLMTKVVKAIANVQRSPVLRRPDEYGMDYEDVSFQAADGTNLEGWFIPAKNTSNKVVICNHFSPGNRYGYAGHIKPWRNAGGFEVNFLPKYEALHKAGYHILAYDLRNHGMSAPAQNGGYNPNLFEYKDVIGSINYIRNRADTAAMDIYLHSMCLGANATLVAMKKSPETFEGIKSMLLTQPISGDALVRKLCKNLWLGEKGYDVFEQKYREIWGYSITDSSPIQDAVHVQIPTLVTQVRNDKFTLPDDVQQIFDAIPVTDKKLHWIDGTTQRFKGYTYYSEHPEKMIDWFNSH